MRFRGLFGLLFLIVAFLFSGVFRIETALRAPEFDAVRAEGMLRSDPALLFYITERILDAGGGMPDDFRADPRVQHPDTTDLLAEFTVGQEFLVAWAYRFFGGEMPLHTFCVRLMAWITSITAIGLYLAVLFRSKSPVWAVLAVLLYAVVAANYRTIGFILVREDLSFPLFALHLGLLARATGVGGARAFLVAGLPLAGALATWHAMGFFVALELGVLALGFLRTGESPFELDGAWAVLIGPVLAGVLVPALAASGFLFGLPMSIAWALLSVAVVRRRRALTATQAVGTALMTAGVLLVLRALVGPARSGYSHVYDVLWSKIRLLGALPGDPSELPFDARLLWQGPFETLPVGDLFAYLGWSLPLLFVALVFAVRCRLRGFEAFLLALGLLSLPIAWLFGRAIILAGLLLPAASAIALSHMERRRLAFGLFGGALLLQAIGFARVADSYVLTWYLPPGQKDEIAALVDWVGRNVHVDEPIAADFVNSTALLAHAGNPIVLQPKYETERSRRKAEAFLDGFFRRTPAEFHRLLSERFRCRHVLIDRYTLGRLSWYTAGLTGPTPPPDTAAEVFLSQEASVLEGVPGFELVYRSPDSIRQVNGEPYDLFRLYRLR